MYSSNSIAVLSVNDRNEENRENKLIEEVIKSEVNPFQRVSDRCFSYVHHVYNNYLYSTGTIFIGALFWTFYPTYARYRHAHLWRYRKNQIRVLRYVFGTEHIPAWNKKYLHRIIIPLTANTFQRPQETSVMLSNTCSNSKQFPRIEESKETFKNTASFNRVNEVVTQSKEKNAVKNLEVRESRELITIYPSESGKFYNWWSKESYKKLIKEIDILNNKLQEPHNFKANSINHKLFLVNQNSNSCAANDNSIDNNKLRSIVKDLVERCDSTLILVQSHEKVMSIHDSCEIWWVSAEERHRRNFCWYALAMLAFFRCMQDLTYLPEMPDPTINEGQFTTTSLNDNY